MLKSMRKNLKSLAPTLWFVIVAFIISIFAVWGGAGRLGESGASNTLARVGKEKISVNLYLQNLRQRLDMVEKQFKDMDKSMIKQLNLPQQVLQQMIQQSLLYQLAQKMGIKATEEEIREKIMSYPVFQKEGNFVGFEQYKKILEWNRISVSQFEESLRKEIILNKTLNVLTSGITVTSQELWEYYKKNNETASIEYAVLETENVDLKREPREEELRDYFKKHQNEYQIPEKRQGIFVLINTEEVKKEIEVSDSEIEKYYQQNKSQFKEPPQIKVRRIYLPYEEEEKNKIKRKAQDILDKIHQGEDFGELAKTYSKGEKAEQKGEWGSYEWRKLSSKEQQAIEELSEGEVSKLIQVEEGISILQVTQREPSMIKPLKQVKQRIISILKDQKARKLAKQRINQLRKRAKKEKSLETAAQKMGYKAKNTGLVKRGTPIEEVDSSGSISQELFNLQKQEISSPVYTYEGISLIQLLHITPPREAKFEEVKQKVKDEVKKIKKKQKALQIMEKVKQQVNGVSLVNLADKYDLEYKTVEKHKRGQYLSMVGENRKIDQISFSHPLNEVSPPVEYKDGYVLVRPLSRDEVTKEEFKKNKEEVKENILQEKRNRFLQSYLNQLRKQKGVRIKQELFQKINADVLSRY